MARRRYLPVPVRYLERVLPAILFKFTISKSGFDYFPCILQKVVLYTRLVENSARFYCSIFFWNFESSCDVSYRMLYSHIEYCMSLGSLLYGPSMPGYGLLENAHPSNICLEWALSRHPNCY